MYGTYTTFLHSLSVWCTTRFSCSLPSSVDHFHLHRIILLEVTVLLSLWPMSSSLFVFLPHIIFFQFASSSVSFSFSILPFIFSLIMNPLKAIYKSINGNDFVKSARDRGLKIDNYAVLEKEHDDSFMILGLGQSPARP